MKNFTLVLLLLMGYSAQSQIGFGTPSPDQSAVLELSSTNKGFLPPRLTTTERDAIAQPAEGLTIYNVTKNCLEWYIGSGWYNSCGDNGVATVTSYVCNTLVTGTMKIGTPVSGVSQTITATVSVPGSYAISATANGVTFSARGNFTSIGNHDIVLHAAGTPVAGGNHTFTLNTSPNSCSFSRTTDLNIGVVASYNCNAPQTGNLTVGVTATGVTKTIIVDVTTVGIYNIQATANGVTFAATGTFLGTGTQNIVLTATGTPQAIGFYTYVLNTSPNCSFTRVATDSSTVVGGAGRIWMAYNLGATAPATSSTDSAQYGDLYQWGRLTDGHEKRNSPTTSTKSLTDNPGHGNFIINGTNWRSPANTNLWQGSNGINNPCPNGFRVPTAKEWNDEITASGIRNSITAYNSVLKLPLPGSRFSDGTYSSVNRVGIYWTSESNGFTFPYKYINITSTNTSIRDISNTANGFSIRCIKN